MSTKINYIGQHVENLRTEEVSEISVLPYLSVEQVKTFHLIFGFLNNKDRDVLYLIFVSRKKQKDVQKILRHSQPSLCYDIKRIRKRLRYIFYLHSVFDIFLKFVQEQVDNFTPEEIRVLTLMFYTSSFTMTSEIMDCSQVSVRYAYDKCLRRMEALELWEVYEIFMVIRENLNAIKRYYKGDVFDLKSLRAIKV